VIVFCDIDGTVADNSHREGFLQQSTPDWDSFYRPDLMIEDRPFVQSIRPVRKLWRRAYLLFLTGRRESTRTVTEQWVWIHFGIDLVTNNDRLLMRKDGDKRHAVDYKREQILRLNQLPGGRLFIDDDERNKDMYDELGLFLKAPNCWESFR
jgi:hypothetical protein